MNMEQPGEDVLECGRRRMTRVVCESGQPRRMETCGAEEPYEGNLHVRFCGGIGRVIADPTRTKGARRPPHRSSPLTGRYKPRDDRIKRKWSATPATKAALWWERILR